MKFIYLDLETTGVDPKRCAITQLTCIKNEWVKGTLIESTLDLRLKPHPGAKIDLDALTVTGLTMDDLEDPARITFADAYKQFVDFCGQPRFVKQEHRFFLVGYNVLGFDCLFLSELGSRSGDKYTWARWHWPAMDVAVLAAYELMHKRHRMANFKLMTVARELGITVDEEKAHDALYDVTITKEMFQQFTQGDEAWMIPEGA